MTIAECARITRLHENYIRQCVQRGEIHAELKPRKVGIGTHFAHDTMAYDVDPESLQRWRDRPKHAGGRPKGSKFQHPAGCQCPMHGGHAVRENASERLNISVSLDTVHAIKRAAQSLNISQSEFMRQAIEWALMEVRHG